MKKVSVFLWALTLTFGFVCPANATLYDMGDQTIYDTDLKLTWLKDAEMGGVKNLADALAWAGTLVFAGFDNWRLPVAVPNPEGTGNVTYNMTGSELGHLYYTELLNDPALGGPAPPLNAGPFINLHQDVFWSYGPGYPGGGWMWVFNFSGGGQALGYDLSEMGAWAVREGERSAPVPEPAAMLLFASGLAAWAGFRKKFRKYTD